MKHFLPVLIGAVLAAGVSKSQPAPTPSTEQQQSSEASTSFHGDGNSVTRVGDCVMLSSPDVSFSGSGC